MFGWTGYPGTLGFVMVGALAVGCASDDRGAASEDSGDSAATSGASGVDGEGSGGFTTAATSSPGSDGDTAGTSGAGSTGGDEPDIPPDDPEGESSSSSTGEPACDDETPVELFLSPDDSNSMSSPVQVRDAVMDEWASVYELPVRTWEFLNYYAFAYEAAAAGQLAVVPSLYRDETMAEGEYVLQIGVSSEHVAAADRAPMNVTFVLDTSGSMSGHPIEMLKTTCRKILSRLREGDVVSMVTWDTANLVVLSGHEVAGPEDPAVLGAIADIEAGGGTDLHSGLVAGYDLAQQSYNANRINRIVLISDGGANVGITDVDIIADHAGGENEDGIYMVGVGVGTAGTYNDQLMDDVTDAGKGASVFINDAAEADRIFVDQFVSTMGVAARDVQVKLDLPPGFEILRFSGEEFSANPEEVEPQHIGPNDAMVFHQKLGTCAPDLVEGASITVSVRYKDAITFEEREVVVESTFEELLAVSDPLLLKGAAVFEYAEALKMYKKAGYMPAAEQAALQPAAAALERAQAVLPDDPDLAEIRDVLNMLFE